MDYNLHNKKDPAMAAVGQIALGMTMVAGMFEDAMAELFRIPQHDNKFTVAEVQRIVDNANEMNARHQARIKEALDIIYMAANVEERLLVEKAGYEHRIDTLKALLAAEEAKVAQLEAELDEAEGGSSTVRISIQKAG